MLHHALGVEFVGRYEEKIIGRVVEEIRHIWIYRLRHVVGGKRSCSPSNHWILGSLEQRNDRLLIRPHDLGEQSLQIDFGS